MTFLFEKDRAMIDKSVGIKWDVQSGKPLEELRCICESLLEESAGEEYILTKAKLMACVFENAQLEKDTNQLFSIRINHGDLLTDFRIKRLKKIRENEMAEILKEYNDGVACLAFTGEYDFSHTVPDWNAILKLGLPGLLERLVQYKKGANVKEKVFYEAGEIAYTAWIKLLHRMAEGEERELCKKSLENLAVGAPTSLYEAMLLMSIFYYYQTYVDCINVRSLGRLDKLLYPYYKNDLETGRYTETELQEFIKYFFYHFYMVRAIANTPFCLCGADENSDEVTNELTYVMLDIYDNLNIKDPKIHIRCGKNLPSKVVEKTLEMIRNGRNSILYINDEVVFDSMRKIGIEEKDIVNYVPVGCYEPTAAGEEVACSCAGRVNIPKAVETAMRSGCDGITGKLIGVNENGVVHQTFDEFYASVKKQLSFFMDASMNLICEYERNYMQINPAPIFSATLKNCVDRGMDAYEGGAKYNNSSINAFGLANAVDSLVVIKNAVFDEKIITMKELCQILDENWSKSEPLRQQFMERYAKYGNNQTEADELMVDLTQYISGYINNKPNARGGVFRCGLFSIDWRESFGRRTAASADGRYCGEPLSKNMSAVLGMDKKGVTSLINSVAKIDYTDVPNGTVLDIVLHASAVSGKDGLHALKGLIQTFLKKGGIAIQCTVLDPSVLREAQKHPEQYKTLQVRLCGWNVYFIELDKMEQEYFIRQASESAGV